MSVSDVFSKNGFKNLIEKNPKSVRTIDLSIPILIKENRKK